MGKVFSRAWRSTAVTSDLMALYMLWRRPSYLKELGWFKSFRAGMPVDKNDQALPWYTYAAISFLEERIDKHMSVFEYGSGSSTIWWSARVSRVVSCEHDEKWYQFMKPKLLPTVEYVHCPLVPGGEYSKVVGRYKEEFDVVVIDGRDRVNCAANSLRALKQNGVVVWDNSDLERYREGHDYLLANGFGRLDFHDLGPINVHGWCTSVFYQSANCLGI